MVMMDLTVDLMVLVILMVNRVFIYMILVNPMMWY